MGVLSMLVMALTHPNQFRILIHYYLWHDQKRNITDVREHSTSGWNRESMRRCWELLDLTSRSFSAVIKELDGDLARTICLFYLILRGLDTVEDDMTLPDDIKQPLLRSFHEKTTTPGWTFNDSGPNEKDRQVLVEYNIIVDEVRLLEPHYRTVLLDICAKMEVGMADYAHKAATSGAIYLEKIEDYDLYCHYVAGLVGEGLSRIFSASGKEAPWLGEQLMLSNSMGLLLQKTNILRDFHEDVVDKRFFWPREIWGEYGFKGMKEMCAPENVDRALWAMSGMTVDALRHAVDALDYLSLLQNQSVFNFCAIPATMAMATLALCFMNPAVLQRNVKITKAAAAQLIMSSTNPRDVAYMFRDYTRSIHAKALPTDPNFLRVSVACGKIEQWCEHHYPSFVSVSNATGAIQQRFNMSDARSRIVQRDQKRANELAIATRAQDLNGGKPIPKPASKDDQPFPWEVLGMILIAFAVVTAVCLGSVYVLLKVFSDEV